MVATASGGITPRHSDRATGSGAPALSREASPCRRYASRPPCSAATASMAGTSGISRSAATAITDRTAYCLARRRRWKAIPAMIAEASQKGTANPPNSNTVRPTNAMTISTQPTTEKTTYMVSSPDCGRPTPNRRPATSTAIPNSSSPAIPERMEGPMSYQIYRTRETSGNIRWKITANSIPRTSRKKTGGRTDSTSVT